MDLLSLFPIGDLHIKGENEMVAFTDYLNERPEELIVLLGDIIHFAHSFWSPNSAEMEKKEFLRALKDDFDLWEGFFRRLKKRTILYYGTHEMFVLETCFRMDWSLPKRPEEINKRISRPLNCEMNEFQEGTYLTGLNIPANIYKRKNPKFMSRKKSIEDLLKKSLTNFNPKTPERIIFCSHEPTDYYYTNMGYTALTNLLEKFPFKSHYYGHIHSNLREDVIGVTPTINRSFISLRRFKREALKPLPAPLRMDV